jgi:macrolide transport system ATP-binding/permease protein
MAEPLLKLCNVSRSYATGDASIVVLEDVSLEVTAGEMIAIVGASGSGKSTLMHLLGCLDQPTTGIYRVAGQSVDGLDEDELAELRREHFGFIFQHYQLLTDLDALGNVEAPAIYADTPRTVRRQRAQDLLQRLGLQARLAHRPNQLSGGQQQRVSIARALMNGGKVILADEPTGALDSQSGEELMRLFSELHAQGHTIVIVTHDMSVAKHAQRIVEIKDGRIVTDRPNCPAPRTSTLFRVQGMPDLEQTIRRSDRAHADRTAWSRGDRLLEVGLLALRSVVAHRLRTFLSMLGIAIGIASVVIVVALGEGSRQRILKRMNEFGQNTVHINPGSMAGDMDASSRDSLSLGDVEALRAQNYVDSVTPVVIVSSLLRYRSISAQASVEGVDSQYFRVHGMVLDEGSFFDSSSVAAQEQEVVIDRQAREALFQNGPAIGRMILVGTTPFRVIGVAAPHSQETSGNRINVWMPHTSAMTRMAGQFNVQRIVLRIAENASTDAALQGISELLASRHGRQDFYTFNSNAVRQLMQQTSDSLRLLVSGIAAISLLVGGIGVMNIMLVSTSERTREIGVRMAIGARKSDIRNQFLSESVLICLTGGLLGIVVALAISLAFKPAEHASNEMYGSSGNQIEMIFTGSSLIVAFLSSTLIGIVFGFVPACRAARMAPVEALAKE